jgi:hypothetical protein
MNKCSVMRACLEDCTIEGAFLAPRVGDERSEQNVLYCRHAYSCNKFT